MGSLLKLALSALAASGQASAFAALRVRMAAGTVLAIGALLLATAAWACACAALWIALIPPLGPVGAPLAVAGACLALAAIMGLVAWLLVRRRRAASLGDEVQLEALVAEAGKLIKEHKLGALVAAALAGFVAGDSTRK